VDRDGSRGRSTAHSSAACSAFITTRRLRVGRIRRPLTGSSARSIAGKRSVISSSSGMRKVSAPKKTVSSWPWMT
jgi:hypothetical protein